MLVKAVYIREYIYIEESNSVQAGRWPVGGELCRDGPWCPGGQ